MAVSFVLVSERGVFLDFRHVWDLLLSSVVQNGEYPPDLMLPGTVKLTTKRIQEVVQLCRKSTPILTGFKRASMVHKSEKGKDRNSCWEQRV